MTSLIAGPHSTRLLKRMAEVVPVALGLDRALTAVTVRLSRSQEHSAQTDS